jgi:hypothetical protein
VTLTITAIASIFPWDPANESAMSHHHLILGYAFAWTVQLAYLLSIVVKQRALRKATTKG